MYHFKYADKKEVKRVKKQIITILNRVQDILRDVFTFRYDFIGSSKLNMITYDPTTNIGFDFDINIEPNYEDEEYNPKEIKTKLINALNEVIRKYGYKSCENSTRVITFKLVDEKNKKIKHSCDIAIVNNYVENGNKQQEYIKYDKNQNEYYWEQQPEGYYLDKKIDWINKNKHWKEVIDLYIDLKNNNKNKDKKSRSLRAEAINNIYNKYNKSINQKKEL